MKRFIAAFCNNTVFANILLIMIFLGGILAAANMIRETFPEFSVDIIQVSVMYPGADPEEVEEGISRKVEEAIDGLEGIKQYTTMSNENISGTVIEVLEGYDVREVKDRVENEVNAIPNLPVDAEKPIISEITIRNEVVGIALSGPLGERELKEWAERVKDELLLLPEVSQVDIVGARDYEIAIEVSEEKLREYGLTFDQVAMAVRASSLNQAGGTLRTRGEEIRLRTVERKYWGEEFANIVVLARPTGEIITLEKLATIRDGFEEDRVISKLDGEPSILVMVYKTNEEDAIQISGAAARYVEEKQRELPEGLKISVWSDTSDFIRARINLLMKNGTIGLIFVFFLLWLFLDLRLSFWSAMGIPISLSGALALMWAVGATINMISLFGLIMVLGIIVDDAIVVGEAIYVHRKNGDGQMQAAVNGVLEVGLPVIAAVTTTIAAFFPLMFVGGIMGKFIFILPVAVIAALSISLIECLFLLPAHLSHLPDPNAPSTSKWRIRRAMQRFRIVFSDGLEWLMEHVYAPFVRTAVHFRYVGFCVAVAVLLFTLGLVQGGIIKYVMFPPVDGNDITVNLEFPNGTPIEITGQAVNRVIDAFDRVAAKGKNRTLTGEPLQKHIFSLVGATIGDVMERKAGPHVGAVRAELLESEFRGVHSKALMQEWEDEIGDIPGLVSLSLSGMEGGPPGKPIEIWLRGDDMDELIAAGDDLVEKLESFDGLYQVESDYRPGKDEIRFKLKPEARTLGITVQDLARQVYAGYYGEEALRIQRGRDDIRVKVRYPESQRSKVSDLDEMRIRTPLGKEVPLRTVADFSYGPGFSVITRTDGWRRVSVDADVDDKRANAEEVIADLQANYFPELRKKYPGMLVSVEGAQKNTRESLSTLKIGYPIAMLAIFVIIATIFRSYAQPLIIMVTVPFGIIGAIYGHLLMGFPITLISLFGIVALAGVVVNDAIVLIECINSLLASGTPFYEALERGGVRRFRAIFLTTASTVGGLTPMILEKDLQAQFLIPMAISIAAGVSFATLLTLVLIPCLLAILNDFRRLIRLIRTNHWPTPEEVEPGTDRYVDILGAEESAQAAAAANDKDTEGPPDPVLAPK